MHAAMLGSLSHYKVEEQAAKEQSADVLGSA